MGDYMEGRSRACWVCKYFVQNSETYRNGICARHAPDKIDENGGVGPTGYAVFPNVNDSENAFCGEFAKALIASTQTPIPIQEPAS